MGVRRATLIGGIALIAALTVAELAFPIYPTWKNLCTLIEERADEPNRHASPHAGAVLVVRGTLHGGSGGMYFFTADCNRGEALAGVSLAPIVLATPESRRALAELRNSDWQGHDRSAPFTLLVRVRSEIQSCFGPGMVLTAIAARQGSARGGV